MNTQLIHRKITIFNFFVIFLPQNFSVSKFFTTFALAIRKERKDIFAL